MFRPASIVYMSIVLFFSILNLQGQDAFYKDSGQLNFGFELNSFGGQKVGSLIGAGFEFNKIQLIDFDENGNVLQAFNIFRDDDYRPEIWINAVENIEEDIFWMNGNGYGTILIRLNAQREIVYSKLLSYYNQQFAHYIDFQDPFVEQDGSVIAGKILDENIFTLFRINNVGGIQKSKMYRTDPNLSVRPKQIEKIGNQYFLFSSAWYDNKTSQTCISILDEDLKILQNFYFDNIDLKDVMVSDTDEFIILAKQKEINDRTVLIKMNKELEIIWQNEINIEHAGVIHDSGNLLLQLDNGDFLLAERWINEPISLLKLSKNGDIINAKMLLDSLGDNYVKIKNFNTDQFILSYATGEFITVEKDDFDCKLPILDICPELKPTQYSLSTFSISETNGQLELSDLSLDVEAINIDFTDAFSAMHSPSAIFSLKDYELCPGDSLEIHKDIYPHGTSLWISSCGDTLQGKEDISFPVYDEDTVFVKHILTIGGCDYTYQDYAIVLRSVRDLLGADARICDDEYVIELDSVNLLNVLWHDASNDFLKTFDSSQLVLIQAQDIYGCFLSDSMRLSLDSFPELDFTGHYQFCSPQELYFDVPKEEKGKFYWETGSVDSIIWVDEDFEMIAFLENSCGIDSDTVYFEIIDCEDLPPIPNAFSPNNDGFNDTFIADLSGYKVVGWSVFDRWGNELATASRNDLGTNSKIIWDGKCRGQLLNPGVYVLIAEITHELSNNSRFITASITLLR